MEKTKNLEQKTALLAAISPTNRGMDATPDQKEAIAAACTQLEAENPNPNPTESMELLEGKWRLLYTTTPIEKNTTLARLAFGRFPPVSVQGSEIYQCICASDASYENIIEIWVEPSLELTLNVRARFEIVSPQRLQINFEEVILSPKVLNVEWQNWLKTSGISNSEESSVSIPLSAPGWTDTTYLDADLRLARGNVGNIYVLTKD